MNHRDVEPANAAIGRSEMLVAVESCNFPGVYLRMDGHDVRSSEGDRSGTVNCQFGHRSLEAFRFVRHPDGDGSVAIESIKYPGVFLRVDGKGDVEDPQVAAGRGGQEPRGPVKAPRADVRREPAFGREHAVQRRTREAEAARELVRAQLARARGEGCAAHTRPTWFG